MVAWTRGRSYQELTASVAARSYGLPLPGGRSDCQSIVIKVHEDLGVEIIGDGQPAPPSLLLLLLLSPPGGSCDESISCLKFCCCNVLGGRMGKRIDTIPENGYHLNGRARCCWRPRQADHLRSLQHFIKTTANRLTVFAQQCCVNEGAAMRISRDRK